MWWRSSGAAVGSSITARQRARTAMASSCTEAHPLNHTAREQQLRTTTRRWVVLGLMVLSG